VFNSSRPLFAGDTVVLMDGTYTVSTNGRAWINCGTNARDGTAPLPVSLKALNERKAHIQGDGRDALDIRQCSHWKIEGLRVSNVDNSSVQAWEGQSVNVLNCDNLLFKRMLVTRPNRTCPPTANVGCNTTAFIVSGSTGVLVEESETYNYHRHGFSAYQSDHITFRRCYSYTAAGGNVTGGFVIYDADDCLLENVVAENDGPSGEISLPASLRTRVLGSVISDGEYGFRSQSRNFGSGVLPAGNATVRNSVFASSDFNGAYARGANSTLLENVTVIGSGGDGVAADEDLTEPAACSSNPQGCSITARNLLSIENSGIGMRVDTAVVSPWLIEYSRIAGNSGGNFPTGETPGDSIGNIRNSSSAAVTGIGTDTNECLMWIPVGHALKEAGKSGADIGANILYRYDNGVLTNEPLWDVSTGQFPCGAVIAGINDSTTRSCSTVHTRLNVNTDGCSFPAGYGTPTATTTTTTIVPTGPPDWTSHLDYVWKMDEVGSATRVNAGSGTDGNLTNNNSVDQATTQKQEGSAAADFDYISPGDRLTNTTASSPSLGYTGAFVVGCWARSEESTYRGVLKRTDLTNHGYSLVASGSTATEKVTWTTWDNALTAPKDCQCETSSGAYPLNTYRHVVGIFSGSAQFIYLNGKKRDCAFCSNCTLSGGSCTRSALTAGGEFTIGGSGTGLSQPFDGQIDECFTDTGWSATSSSDGLLDPESLCRICSCEIDGSRCACSGTSYTNSGRNDSCGNCTLPPCDRGQP
jgi:hypothetical protein